MSVRVFLALLVELIEEAVSVSPLLPQVLSSAFLDGLLCPLHVFDASIPPDAVDLFDLPFEALDVRSHQVIQLGVSSFEHFLDISQGTIEELIHFDFVLQSFVLALVKFGHLSTEHLLEHQPVIGPDSFGSSEHCCVHVVGETIDLVS